MWLIIRELFGWVLIAAGLAMIGFVLILANNRSVLEALAVSLPATVVFRSGIGFVRLAVAGRIAAKISTSAVDSATRSPR